MKKHLLWISPLAALSLGVAFALRAKEKTELPVKAISPNIVVRAEGRVAAYPGSDVTVGTDPGGTLLEVRVKEGDEVRRGQVLALIDPRQEQAALQEARSRVRELEADARFLETELNRSEKLQRQGIVSRQSLDQARNQVELTKARREAAQATADRLEVGLSKLQVLSPMDGRIVSRLAQPGETVPPGSKLFQIVQPQRTRIEAEIDEFDLSRIRLGMPVRVRAEGCDASWPAEVEEIPDQVIGRRLKPQDPARPSDTRVLMVKVALKAATPLKLGQRVELELTPCGN